MPRATTLRQLLDIRKRHARFLRGLSGYLGSAVGCKYHEDGGEFARDEAGALIPAVMVFVRRKVGEKELAPSERVPPELSGPGGTSCRTDVVVGTLAEGAEAPERATAANRRLLRELWEGDIGFTGGMPLASAFSTGTAACAIRSRRKLGLLTNWHIAGFFQGRMIRPSPHMALAGQTGETVLFAPHTPRNPDDLESFTDARHRVDAAFVELPSGAEAGVRPGVHGLGPLGPPHRLDLDSLEVIGRRVVSVGGALGLQRGRIAAYGYEWRADAESRFYSATDYLILGEDGSPFAAPGDSGKLVVSDDDRREPIALLWGGQRQEFWSADAQESWAYASAIGLVLEHLGASIVGSGAQPINVHL